MKKKILALLTTAMVIASFSATIAGCAAMKTEDKFRRMPKARHEAEFPKGHDGSASCYYDEKNDVYFCQY